MPISESDGVRVEIEDIGEGISGDYDENDPEDIPLVRFYISCLVNGEWEELEDASYCTQLPATLDENLLKVATDIILEEVKDRILEGHSIKKICERLSWIGEENVRNNTSPVVGVW